MIAHQKVIREHLRDDHPVPADFSQAVVREIELSLAQTVILKYEYLGTMGSARRAFGLFFDGELAGVECFGSTGGTNTAQSVCGPENADRVMTLNRGACVAWAHPHSASYLISRACNLLALEDKNVFIGYCDPDAGERGVIYRALNWRFCGMTNPKGSMFVAPSGLAQDERQISNLQRNIGHFQRARSGSADCIAFFPKPTRAEMRERMVREGYTFHSRTAKHRYVGTYGDHRIVTTLRRALRWNILPYPKGED